MLRQPDLFDCADCTPISVFRSAQIFRTTEQLPTFCLLFVCHMRAVEDHNENVSHQR